MNRSARNWAVAGFFVFYFIILQLANDWQYRDVLDNGDTWYTFKYRLISVPMDMLAFFIYYKWQVPLLFKRKFGWFLLSVLLFIMLFDVYIHIIDWVTTHISFRFNIKLKYPPVKWNSYSFPRQSFHFTFIHLFAVTGFAYFINRWEADNTIRQLKEQQLQLQLNYLKAQLHPHFFFNTLNNIYSLALYQSVKTAPMLEGLSQLMRYIVYNSKEDKVALVKEIEFIKNFVQLEKLRHEDNVSISFAVQGNADGISIPPLLFMPLVENCFKHGMNNTQNPCATIEMLVENNEIIFVARNSYMQNTQNSEAGIGLANLQERLNLLYPQKHSLAIQQTGNQFEVTLTLALA